MIELNILLYDITLLTQSVHGSLGYLHSFIARREATTKDFNSYLSERLSLLAALWVSLEKKILERYWSKYHLRIEGVYLKSIASPKTPPHPP